MKIINLISGPRNLSTALMYSFAQRNDIEVIDEPYYGCYLKVGNVSIKHPAEAKILEEMSVKENDVTQEIERKAEESHIFIKNMAHHILSKSPVHILSWENIILIRHPKKLIASFSKVIENPSIADIGIKRASELFLFLKENGKEPLVIDSDELLSDPENYLKLICKKLGLPFQKEMLSWKKGGIPQDGIWADHWYGNVHNSTGFAIQKTSDAPVPERLEGLLKEAMSYYNILKKQILKNQILKNQRNVTKS